MELTDAYEDERVSTVIESAALPATQVDPLPVAVAVTRETILTEYLDYLHYEAFYEINFEFEVTAYRTTGLDCSTIAGRSRGRRQSATVRSEPCAGTTVNQSVTTTPRVSSAVSRTPSATWWVVDCSRPVKRSTILRVVEYLDNDHVWLRARRTIDGNRDM